MLITNLTSILNLIKLGKMILYLGTEGVLHNRVTCNLLPHEIHYDYVANFPSLISKKSKLVLMFRKSESTCYWYWFVLLLNCNFWYKLLNYLLFIVVCGDSNVNLRWYQGRIVLYVVFLHLAMSWSMRVIRWGLLCEILLCYEWILDVIFFVQRSDTY